MGSFTLKQGESKKYVVVGFADDGEGGEVEIGPVPAKVTSSDNHTIQVSDKGDGTGTVTAVGNAGGSAVVTADDGQGHSVTLSGQIATPPTVVRIEIRIVEDG